FREVAEKLPGVKVRMGTMDDFVNALLADPPELQVVKGEMPDTWIHGIMCDPGGIRLSREVHSLLASVEALNTQLRIWGEDVPSIASPIALAYEKSILYGEHTWGGSKSINAYGEAFEKIPPETYADLESSWEDKTDYIRDAAKIVRGLADSSLETLARRVNHPGPGVIVYNPLPWERSGIVEANGKKMYVKDVPPCGYKTVPLESGKTIESPTDSAHTIENGFFRISIDAGKGSIVSLIDKRTGRDWVDHSAKQGLGHYLNERFTFEQTLKYVTDYQQGRAWHAFGATGEWPHPGLHKPGMISEEQVPYRAASSGQGKLKIIRTPVSQSAILDMPGRKDDHFPASRMQVSLYQAQPYIDLEMTILDKAKDNWPEADWLCLPFDVKNPTFRVYRALGVMDPATDILKGANRHLFSVGHGVALTEPDGSGVVVSPLDHPLVSLDTPGCWQFSMDFVPKKPVIYLNLYNNQWNTNFRYWYAGTWSSRVRIWTIDKDTPPEALAATPALEARHPLQAVATEGQGGTLPLEQQGLTVSRKGIAVTAFGTDPDGSQGILLRVWEQAGTSGMVTVTLPEGARASKAMPVNLRGETRGAPVQIEDGAFTFDLHAYAPASFLLQ
ncbi:MAG: hypothetical protein HQ515_12205, partial [Phycisphaeraceae bacterium]|nr:hypothetical protein [Phycisphaeraceae bacterium]